jgi:hypothetical protein
MVAAMKTAEKLAASMMRPPVRPSKSFTTKSSASTIAPKSEVDLRLRTSRTITPMTSACCVDHVSATLKHWLAFGTPRQTHRSRAHSRVLGAGGRPASPVSVRHWDAEDARASLGWPRDPAGIQRRRQGLPMIGGADVLVPGPCVHTGEWWSWFSVPASVLPSTPSPLCSFHPLAPVFIAPARGRGRCTYPFELDRTGGRSVSGWGPFRERSMNGRVRRTFG